MSTRFSRETSLAAKPFIYADEIEFLQALFMNSNKFVFGEPVKRSTFSGRPPEQPKTLRVALISFKMPNPLAYIKTGSQDRPPYIDEKDYEYVRFDDNSPTLSADEIVDIVAVCLDEAHAPDKQVHFVLMNELAVSYIDSKHLIQRLQGKFTEKDVRSAIGILGSFHCDEFFYNVSPIVSPFMSGGHEYRTVKHVLKQSSARKEGEHIRTPDETVFVRYETPYGEMMVWICLDMYDPNLVLKLIRNNYRLSLDRQSGPDGDKTIDILFIPSYNSDLEQNVRNIAKMISKYARMTVFLSNDSMNLESDKTGWNENMCYHMGKEIPQKGGSDSKKYNLSIFEIENWPGRYDQMSDPFPNEFSSLFSHILGLHTASFKAL